MQEAPYTSLMAILEPLLGPERIPTQVGAVLLPGGRILPLPTFLHPRPRSLVQENSSQLPWMEVVFPTMDILGHIVCIPAL